MLENVKNLLSDGVTALGGILIVFGLVNLGLTIKDGMQGGGGQLSGALAMIIGGAIVVGATIPFAMSASRSSTARPMSTSSRPVTPVTPPTSPSPMRSW